MKNIHVLPTPNPSRLHLKSDGYYLSKDISSYIPYSYPKNIYITSNEEIKEGDYWIYISPPEWKDTDRIEVVKNVLPNSWFCKLHDKENYKNVILTTDQDLISDGVQAIDDEFLEWFVKNPSCEWVEVQKWSSLAECGYSYHIIIPKEKPEQETLEEAIVDYSNGAIQQLAFLNGAKWQQERSYSEEEVLELLEKIQQQVAIDYNDKFLFAKEWFEQFKKK